MRERARSEGRGPNSASWDVDALTTALSEARNASSQAGYERNARRRDEARRRERPARDALVEIIRGLRSALFPAHFGVSDFSEPSLDAFVRGALDTSLHELVEQVRRDLAYNAARASTAHLARAREIVATLAEKLPALRITLEHDIRAAYDGDPAALSRAEILLCYPGITAITHHRIAHELHVLGVPLLARILAQIAHSTTGIDIHPGANIGSSFFIDHGTGVVIGETAIIGERVRIYQGVTLGARNFPRDVEGSVVKGRPRHPIIEDDVVIYAGATILGRVTIGRGSTIGGNVWLTHSVPPQSHIRQAQPRRNMFSDGGGI
jgi:serine O-acetyltransferase